MKGDTWRFLSVLAIIVALTYGEPDILGNLHAWAVRITAPPPLAAPADCRADDWRPRHESNLEPPA